MIRRRSNREDAMAIKTINPRIEVPARQLPLLASRQIRRAVAREIGTGADGKVPADLTEEFTSAWTKVGQRAEGGRCRLQRRARIHDISRRIAEHDGHVHEGARSVPEGTVARMDRNRHHGTSGSRRARRNTGDRSQTQMTDSFWRDPPGAAAGPATASGAAADRTERAVARSDRPRGVRA